MLAAQYYMLTFLPLSHPQSYLPLLFKLWESVNSYIYDERMLQFLSRIAEMHVDPTISDPKRLEAIPDDEQSEGEGRPNWPKDDLESKWRWSGLFKEVGVFTEREWNFIMCKCLASMGMSNSFDMPFYRDLQFSTDRDTARRRRVPDHRPECR